MQSSFEKNRDLAIITAVVAILLIILFIKGESRQVIFTGIVTNAVVYVTFANMKRLEII